MPWTAGERRRPIGWMILFLYRIGQLFIGPPNEIIAQWWNFCWNKERREMFKHMTLRQRQVFVRTNLYERCLKQWRQTRVRRTSTTRSRVSPFFVDCRIHRFTCQSSDRSKLSTPSCFSLHLKHVFFIIANHSGAGRQSNDHAARPGRRRSIGNGFHRIRFSQVTGRRLVQSSGRSSLRRISVGSDRETSSFTSYSYSTWSWRRPIERQSHVGSDRADTRRINLSIRRCLIFKRDWPKREKKSTSIQLEANNRMICQ